MARIRTIKPGFFRNEDLYEAERDSGLPLRVAFAGLWTAADREGRFRWQPRALKLDCLPYDEVDFSRVLDALATRGFIVKYAIDGVEYGHIPTWKKHQVINNREKASDLPAPTNQAVDACATREPRDTDLHKGKGREQEGKGREEDAAVAAPTKYAFEAGTIRLTKKDLDKWKCSFSYLDVPAELTGLQQWAETQRDWFFAVAGALAKRNREVKKARESPPVDANKQYWGNRTPGIL